MTSVSLTWTEKQKQWNTNGGLSFQLTTESIYFYFLLNYNIKQGNPTRHGGFQWALELFLYSELF